MAAIAARAFPLVIRSIRERRARAALPAWLSSALVLYFVFQALRHSPGSAAYLLGPRIKPLFQVLAASVVQDAAKTSSLVVGAMLALLMITITVLSLKLRDRAALFWVYLLAFATIFALLVAVARGGH